MYTFCLKVTILEFTSLPFMKDDEVETSHEDYKNILVWNMGRLRQDHKYKLLQSVVFEERKECGNLNPVFCLFKYIEFHTVKISTVGYII